MQKMIFFLLSITSIFPIISMDPDTKALFDAVQINDINEVKKLLGSYADATSLNNNNQTILTLAIDMENLPMVTTILDYALVRQKIDDSDNNGNTPLMLAVDKGNIDIIKEILNEIPDPSIKNKEDKTAMSFTLLNPRLNRVSQRDAIELLTNAHKQYNLYKEVNKPISDISAIKAILTPEFKVLNTPNPDRNSLIAAIRLSALLPYDKSIISLLIEHGANVNQILRDGETPLTTAIESRQVATTKELLAAGADPLMPLKKGKTALAIVQKRLTKELPDDIRKALQEIYKAFQATISAQLISLLQTLTQSLNALQKILTLK